MDISNFIIFTVIFSWLTSGFCLWLGYRMGKMSQALNSPMPGQ